MRNWFSGCMLFLCALNVGAAAAGGWGTSLFTGAAVVWLDDRLPRGR